MKQNNERKFDGIWDAKRVMHDYILYADEFGQLPNVEEWENSPNKVRVLRMVAALKAMSLYLICSVTDAYCLICSSGTERDCLL